MGAAPQKSVRDLTEGNVFRQILLYALPMLGSNVLQALYGMVDTLIAGHYIGSSGISAINTSGQVLTLVLQVAIGVTSGGGILIGQYFGAKDEDRRLKAAGNLFSLSIAAGLVISAALFVFSRDLMVLLRSPALEEATAYLRICSVGVLFTWGYNALAISFRAMGNSRYALYFIGFSAVLNTVLDFLMVGAWGMGVRGAALATVIAQGVCFFVALFTMLRHKGIMRFSPSFLRFRAHILLKILGQGVPSAVQMTIVGLSFLVVTFLLNDYGVEVSAANGISIKIKDLCQLALNAMAGATGSALAQNLGARKYDRAKEVLKTSLKLSVAVSLLLMAVVEWFAPQLVALFSPDKAVIDAAVWNLRIEILGQIFYAFFMTYHAMAFGAGHVLLPLCSSFVNCILLRVVLCFLFQQWFGLYGIYIACAVAPAGSVPIGWLYYRSNYWRKHNLVGMPEAG